MREYIISNPNIEYRISVDFEDIEEKIYKYKIEVENIGNSINTLRTYNVLDSRVKYIIEKNTNILKFYNYHKQHHRLELMLYKLFHKYYWEFDNKYLEKHFEDLKNKFKDLFNKRLDNLEDAISNKYLDEGVYLTHMNGVKRSYDNTMREFEIFELTFKPETHYEFSEER